MLTKNMVFIFQNYRYLELLSVLCVCDGVSIADNQNFITDVWLVKGNKVLIKLQVLWAPDSPKNAIVYNILEIDPALFFYRPNHIFHVSHHEINII